MPSYLPRIDIPPGAHPPANVSPAAPSYAPYDFELNSSNGNSYYAGYRGYQQSPGTAHPGLTSGRPIARTISAYEPDSAQFAFPEPDLNRSFSSRSSLRPSFSTRHRNSKSEVSFDRSGSISASASVADFSPQVSVLSVNIHCFYSQFQSEPSILSDHMSHLAWVIIFSHESNTDNR